VCGKPQAKLEKERTALGRTIAKEKRWTFTKVTKKKTTKSDKKRKKRKCVKEGGLGKASVELSR